MVAQIIQILSQITFVRNLGRCEDCEEEERKEALQEDIAEDRVNLSQASLELAENSSSGSFSSGDSSSVDLPQLVVRLFKLVFPPSRAV